MKLIVLYLLLLLVSCALEGIISRYLSYSFSISPGYVLDMLSIAFISVNYSIK